MLTLTAEVSYPPNAQMRLAASFVRFLREASFVRFLREVRNPNPGLCSCPQCRYSERLSEFWEQYQNVAWSRRHTSYGCASSRFSELVYRISHQNITWCEECERVIWQGCSYDVGQTVCGDCYPQYHRCNECGEWYHDNNADEHEHEHEGYSRCKAPHQSFKFPARCLDREIENDERVTITLPSGYISDEGLASIFRYVYAESENSNLYYVLRNNDSLGAEWTTRQGNFPKRIAKLCLQNGVKLTPTLLTQIGNLARQHTSTQSQFHIEVTRDFSAGAAAFANAGSCWFSDYWQSLCMFKQHGGLALRTFSTPGPPQYGDVIVIGRAWVMPLTSTLQPTHDTDTDAYVLFNVYGLSQYEAAHILAQMTSKSYRKVEFDMYRMYINSGVGFLIASQAVCNDVSEISIRREWACRCPYGR